jgi:hypothetical protein
MMIMERDGSLACVDTSNADRTRCAIASPTSMVTKQPADTRLLRIAFALVERRGISLRSYQRNVTIKVLAIGFGVGKPSEDVQR